MGKKPDPPPAKPKNNASSNSRAAAITCELRFAEPSKVKLTKQPDHASNGSSTEIKLSSESFAKYGIRLIHNSVKILQNVGDKSSIGTFSPKRTVTSLDDKKTLLQVKSKDTSQILLEIKGSSDDLTAINHYIQKSAKAVDQLGPLAYDPAFEIRPSYFTQKRKSGVRGLLNLCLIAISMMLIPYLMEHVERGILPQHFNINFDILTTAAFHGSICIPMFLQCIIEYLAYKRFLPSKLPLIFTLANFIFLCWIPIKFVRVHQIHPFLSIIYFIYVMTHLLKFISYSHVHFNIRRISRKAFQLEEEGLDPVEEIGPDVISASNWEIIKKHKGNLGALISLTDMYSFIWMPAMCYQLKYPLLSRRNYLAFIGNLFGGVACCVIIVHITAQFTEPIVIEFPALIESRNYYGIVKQFIKLTIPSTVTWLIFFMSSVFNYQGQGCITKFGDREYYKDWWNCRDMNEYWRLWNIPFHRFFTRHIYYPLIRHKFSKNIALIMVFIFSALMHEYWYAAPLDLVTGMTTAGFLAQAPIMMIQKKIEGIVKDSQFGNLVFWISFCFMGQPFGILTFYLAYREKFLINQ